MRIPSIHVPATVGREDRLVRGCIALSLLLLAGFAIAMSGRPGVISIAFLILGLYFTVTAAAGRDPLYAHFGIDTRAEGDLDSRTTTSPDRLDGSRHWLDLRDEASAPADDQAGNSLLGS